MVMGEVNFSAEYLSVDSWYTCVLKHGGLSVFVFVLCFFSCPQSRHGLVESR